MSSAPRYVPHYTVDDYAQWKGEWELIDGVPIAMTPSPFGPHERVVSRLTRLVGNEIEKHQCGCEVYTNLDWIISSDTVVRPDLVVVCGQQPTRHLERPPAVAVEVLSDSTRRQDTGAKRDLYRENGVLRYLMFDPERRGMEWVCLDRNEPILGDEAAELRLELDDTCSIRFEWARLFD